MTEFPSHHHAFGDTKRRTGAFLADLAADRGGPFSLYLLMRTGGRFVTSGQPDGEKMLSANEATLETDILGSRRRAAEGLR